MFSNDSYKDVLGDNSHRHHLIGSAWIVAIAIAAAVILLFA